MVGLILEKMKGKKNKAKEEIKEELDWRATEGTKINDWGEERKKIKGKNYRKREVRC